MDLSWILWFLVWLGAVLVIVAFLQWRSSIKKSSFDVDLEPGESGQEPGGEYSGSAEIQGNTLTDGTTALEGADQDKSAAVVDYSFRRWLQTIISFVKRSPATQMALELLIILVVVFAFCQGFLQLGSTQELPGNEAQMFQALDWVFYRSVVQDHQFPVWNPWMRTGQPNIADPLFHSLNPLVGLPTLLFGVRDGFKIAVFLSILVAALGMHRLGVSLGLNRVVRVWMALMFAFAGQPLAHVLQGQYLFIFGYAWIPWAIWGLYQLQRTRRMVYIASSALAMALLIFSGNSYYAFYLAIVFVLFAIVAVLNIQRSKPFIKVDWKLFRSYALVAVLTMGLVVIHLLPMIEFSSRMNKGIGIYGSQTPLQVIMDFTSKDTYRQDAFSDLPAREEYYAYIGWMPLMLLALLPFAYRPGRRRMIIFALLSLLYVLLWVDVKDMPWLSLYEQSHFLLQFRHVLRPLVYAGFALLLLAGLELDILWQRMSLAAQPGEVKRKVRQLGAMVIQGVLLVLMLVTVWDLFTTHRPFFQTADACQREGEIASQLTEQDPGEYYTQFIPNNACLKPLLAAGVRFLAPWYAWEDYRQLDGSLPTRLVQATPRYTIQPTANPAPEGSVPMAIQAKDYRVYYQPDSLPMAFSVYSSILDQQNSEALRADEVIPQLPYFDGPNKVEVNVNGQVGEKLILLVTHDPGWQLFVDGEPAAVQKVSGYLATDLIAGTHQYRFVYQPASYTIGMLISLACLFLTIFMAAFDLRNEWSACMVRLRAFWRKLRSINLREMFAHRKRQGKTAFPAGAIFMQSRVVYHAPSQAADVPSKPYIELENQLQVEDGRTIDLIIETPPVGASGRAAAETVSTAWRRWWWATSGLIKVLVRPLSLAGVLFIAALLVYLSTRLIGLTRFPISFLGDEAVQTLYAETLINNNFRDPVTGLYLPIYVEAAGNRWTPLLPMYIHAATLALFGKSVLVTRGTSVLVGLLAAVAVGLTLKQIFKVRLWWLGALVIAIIPTWFLHSRTSYETVMTTAFFAMFLWFYLKYREQGSSIIPALIFGALTFYTYSNAQLIALGAAMLLFLSDIRYHWTRRKDLLKAIPIALLLALPFILFTIKKPAALGVHLRAVDSYWFHNIPLTEKVLTFLKNYSYGLSPAYWFIPNGVDLPRHRMLDIAHLPISMLPFLLIGLLICLWYFRKSRYRTIILVALAVPLGASLVQIGITRELAFIVPACILMVLGIDWLWEQIRSRVHRPLPDWIVSVPLFLVLTIMSFSLLRTSLINGPLWFSDYGLYGMQYGAIQLFEQTIPAYWKENPNLRFRVSSVWANGTERYLGYFLSSEEQQKVDLIGIDGLMSKKYSISPDDIFVLTPSEYEKATQSEKFKSVQVENVIPYPDGNPGFYFVRLAYADNIDQLIEAEAAERKTLKEEVITLDGQPVTVRNSWLDMGVPAQIFDRDPFTLIRGMEANPFILELGFQQPRTLEEITLNLGAMDTDLTAYLYTGDAAEPLQYQQSYRQVQEGDVLRLIFPDGPHLVSRMRLEILSPYAGDIANVHVRELQLLP